MLAILSDRKAWIEKKQSEEAQAAISRMYRRPVTWAGVYAEKAEGTGLHSFPVSATISAVKSEEKKQ